MPFLNIGPPSTRDSVTTRSSMSRAPRSSALPRALLRTCSSRRALLLGRKRSISRASSAVRPRMRLANGRILRADMSAKLWCAEYCMGSPSLGCLGPAARVAAEGPRRGELAELVADHVLRHVQLDELPAVVDGEGEADELRHDGAVTRPRLDRLLAAGPLLLGHLGQQPLVHVRALLQRPTHQFTPPKEENDFVRNAI